jgi:hypothetical protein
MESLGLTLLSKDQGKPASLGDEFPMEKARRVALLKGLPDIRSFRDLGVRDRLPDDPEDSKHLTEGERFWITNAAPHLHRQLVQLLSVCAYLAQESAASVGLITDGTCSQLSPMEFAILCGSLVVLTTDSIRTIVDFQRSRILQAGGRKPPPSVSDKQRKIISEKLEDTMAKQAERQLNLKMSHPSILAPVGKVVKNGGSQPTRRHPSTRRPRFTGFNEVRRDFGRSRSSYDPEVNSFSSSSKPARFSPFTSQQRGRGRGRGKFRGGGGNQWRSYY